MEISSCWDIPLLATEQLEKKIKAINLFIEWCESLLNQEYGYIEWNKEKYEKAKQFKIQLQIELAKRIRW